MKRGFECIAIACRFYFMREHWKQCWSRFLLKAIWILGVIWLLIEFTHFFFGESSLFPRQPIVFWLSLCVSLVASLLFTVPLLSTEKRIQNRDVVIKLVLGSVFNQDGDIIVATNTTFDTTEEGDFISPKSIQGHLGHREYDDLSHLNHEIDEQLANQTPRETLDRTRSKAKRYDIGSVIKLTHRSGFKSYWVALADVNENGKPQGTFANLQLSLESLWRYVSEKGHMTRLIMPIIGSGNTGINESRLAILKEIIFSFVAFAAERKITEELVICIHPSDVSHDKLSMHELAKYLEYQCVYRYETRRAAGTSSEIG